MHVEEIIEHIYIYSQRPYLEMFTSETFPFYVFTNHHYYLQSAGFSSAKRQETCRER